MLTSYCKTAWRNFSRNRISSFINVFGLSIGMAVAMLNGLWIRDELTFNSYHTSHERIGSLMAIQTWMGQKGMNTSMSYPMALAFKEKYKDHFKHIVYASWNTHEILSSGEPKLSGTGVYMTEEAPEMLTLRMKYGTRKGLHEPTDMLLSASISQALFGNADPVGKIIKLNSSHEMRVSGVYEDIPANSSFKDLQFIAPFAVWVGDNPWISTEAIHQWDNHFLRVYAEIYPGATFDNLSAMIKNLEDDHKALFRQDTYVAPEDFLFPMDKWHLYPFKRGDTNTDPAPIHMVRLVGSIGAIVLLLACINFMNLSTASSEKRAREVGIRKTLGSDRRRLVIQFYGESLLIVLFSWILAFGLVLLTLHAFNDLAGKEMSIPWSSAGFWLASLTFVLITALLAGSYPALYLSSFRPVKVLKGSFRMGRFSALPRKLLVTLQFTASVSLVICTIVVYRQIQLGKDRPVGYTREGLIMIEKKSGDFYGKRELLRQELKKTGAIVELSESMGTLTQLWSNNGGFHWKGMDPNLEQNFGTLAVSRRHGATIGWQVVQGRDFSEEGLSDSNAIVMNESAVKYMGVTNPVGMPIGWQFQDQGEMHNYVVVGVVKDLLMESPYNPIKPTFYFLKSLNGGTNWINIRLNPAMSTSAALAKVQKVFHEIIPSAPFEYKFVDEEYANKFVVEQRIGTLAAFFGGLAICISCLGLFGLSLFIASRRTREIGIRKVLGASVFRIWRLLSKEFVYLVLFSCMLAIPIAWYGMHEWIQNYTYRTALAWWIFVAAVLGALLITVFTVSIQSIGAALKNPAESLKVE